MRRRWRVASARGVGDKMERRPLALGGARACLPRAHRRAVCSLKPCKRDDAEQNVDCCPKIATHKATKIIVRALVLCHRSSPQTQKKKTRSTRARVAAAADENRQSRLIRLARPFERFVVRRLTRAALTMRQRAKWRQNKRRRALATIVKLERRAHLAVVSDNQRQYTKISP